jgi:LytS/YehU family sensor histidine kinase
LSEVNIILRDTLQARKYLDSIQQLGLENVRDITRKSYFNYRGQLAFLKARNYKGVKSHIDNYVGYLEHNYEEKYTSDLESLKAANENEKRTLAENQRIELENIQNENRVLFISLFTALLAALAFFVFRNRKFKFERLSLQMQQRLLRSQMNPHFTFNTLYAIQSKIKESPEQASSYLLKFSRLLRLILENSMNNNVALENELDSLKKYIELQLLRFPGKFTYNIELVNLEDSDLIFIPPMLIQPFVENSIEHGFKGIEYSGHIDIILSEQGSFVKCEVKDNGKGVQNQNNAIKKSASVQLISDFIKKSTKTQLSITSRDLKEAASGTKVSFLIPYKSTEHD